MPWLLVVGGQEQDSRLCVRGREAARAASLIPTALLLTSDHQQPRHYTPYEVTTQV